MVKDPAPMLWSWHITLDPEGYGRKGKPLTHAMCKYSTRFDLPCMTSRAKCDYCYMKQQSLVSSDVKRLCDRCGFEMTGADKLSYLKLENRYGGIIAKEELCEACATQLLTWMNNKEFFENFYEAKDEPLVPLENKGYNRRYK